MNHRHRREGVLAVAMTAAVERRPMDMAELKSRTDRFMESAGCKKVIALHDKISSLIEAEGAKVIDANAALLLALSSNPMEAEAGDGPAGEVMAALQAKLTAAAGDMMGFYCLLLDAGENERGANG